MSAYKKALDQALSGNFTAAYSILDESSRSTEQEKALYAKTLIELKKLDNAFDAIKNLQNLSNKILLLSGYFNLLREVQDHKKIQKFFAYVSHQFAIFITSVEVIKVEKLNNLLKVMQEFAIDSLEKNNKQFIGDMNNIYHSLCYKLKQYEYCFNLAENHCNILKNQDLCIAHHIYSAKSGNLDSQFFLVTFMLQGEMEQQKIADHEINLRQLIDNLVDHGHLQSIVLKAQFLYYGTYYDRNVQESELLYEKLVDLDHTQSIFDYALLIKNTNSSSLQDVDMFSKSNYEANELLSGISHKHLGAYNEILQTLIFDAESTYLLLNNKQVSIYTPIDWISQGKAKIGYYFGYQSTDKEIEEQNKNVSCQPFQDKFREDVSEAYSQAEHIHKIHYHKMMYKMYRDGNLCVQQNLNMYERHIKQAALLSKDPEISHEFAKYLLYVKHLKTTTELELMIDLFSISKDNEEFKCDFYIANFIKLAELKICPIKTFWTHYVEKFFDVTCKEEALFVLNNHYNTYEDRYTKFLAYYMLQRSLNLDINDELKGLLCKEQLDNLSQGELEMAIHLCESNAERLESVLDFS